MATWKDKIVILVDDVLNSGRTLIHAVRFVLEGHPREVHTAVLVDRKHRSFPIRADYCGLTLSTHHNEHIAVDLSDPDHARCIWSALFAESTPFEPPAYLGQCIVQGSLGPLPLAPGDVSLTVAGSAGQHHPLDMLRQRRA